jgi:hypothetical protein
MVRRIALTATAAALVLAGGAARAQDAEPTPQHSAACVAALEVEALAMADQMKAGHPEIEPELVRLVQQGFAFIGIAYKQGLRKEEADRLLKQAEADTQTLPPPELSARQQTCRAEGARLLENANAFERAFVRLAAQRRVDRLKNKS